MNDVIVVTGTDTGVGKTVFAAGLAAALGARYWKPVQAGLEDGSDSATAMRLGVRPDDILPESYRLTSPCSPHRAAELDDVRIDPARLALPQGNKVLIVEGAGGALVPITRDLLFASQFAHWGKPVVLVARTGLGTINHSLSSIEVLRARGVPILGVAFVGEAVEDSEATIAAIGRVRRLGRLPLLADLNAATLAHAFAASFNLADFQ